MNRSPSNSGGLADLPGRECRLRRRRICPSVCSPSGIARVAVELEMHDQPLDRILDRHRRRTTSSHSACAAASSRRKLAPLPVRRPASAASSRCDFGFDLGRGRLDHRHGVADPRDLALLGHVVEERQQAIELLLRDRVVLVIVAAGAADRQPQPDRGRRVEPVDRVLDQELFGNDARLRELARWLRLKPVAMSWSSVGVGEQVAGQLLDRELVERHVAVEGVDHPIAPAPHVPLLVALVAVGVGIAGRIEPVGRHALAIARRRRAADRRRFS